MGLRILAGPPGSGKTHQIVREILEENARDPFGPPLILLVPEQATYQAERLLLTSGAAGYVRIEVVSFARLGRWIEARRPRAKLQPLNDVHREVIVTGILAKMKREGSGDGLASIPHLESAVATLLGEMKQGNVHGNELMDWAARVEGTRPALAHKLRQIAAVSRAFDEAVATRFEDPQQTMLSMATSVRELTDLQGAHVYIDSFYGFTAVEREVLRGLLMSFPNVTVTVVLDKPIASVASTLASSGTGSGRSHPSMEMLEQLLRLAEQAGGETPLLVDVTSSRPTESAHRSANAEMAFLSREFLAGNHRNHWMESAPGIRMIEADDLRDQARAAAEQLNRWRDAHGWHWGEMAIMTRNVDSVVQELSEALDSFHIPHFMDRNQPEETHPVVQGTIAAMEAVLKGWRQESILAFAKSGLYDFDVHAVARLEWFVLQYPRREKDWMQGADWEAPPERSPFEPEEGRHRGFRGIGELDAIRRAVMAPLLRLRERFLSAVREEGQLTLRDVVAALCHLIHEGMHPQIEATTPTGNADQQGDDEKVLIQIGQHLDAVAVAAGDDAFEAWVVMDILRSTLGGFRLQRIPPLLNQVVVAQADRSRLHEVKGVVIISLAEGEFPAPGANRSLLSDEDREILSEFAKDSSSEKEIRASSKAMFKREAFIAWMAISRAREAVTLIRPLIDRDGGELKASPWWMEVSRLFPRIEPTATSETPPMERVARAREAASHICSNFGGTRSRTPLLEAATLRHLGRGLTSTDSRREFERVVATALRRNQASLSETMATKALGDEWTASATALESFASCPFHFFMKSIMRANVRQDTQVSVMDLGNLAHAVLKATFDHLRESPTPLEKMEDGEIVALVNFSMDAPLARLQRAGLLTNQLGVIQADLLCDQIAVVVSQFRDLARITPFRNLSTEVSFSKKEGALTPPTIRIAMRDGTERAVTLRGQIDRIDAWGEEEWLIVLDYKLSSRAVTWGAVLDGKSLQLPIYLLVLEENRETLASRTSRIGGAFYQAVSMRGTSGKRLRGMMAGAAFDATGLAEASPALISTGQSKSNPAAGKSGDIVPDDVMTLLTEWARHKITLHLTAIMSGECTVRPARLGTSTPCSTCDHLTACRLDYTMNNARIIEKKSRLEVFEAIAAIKETAP